jgi:tetratricopeptide (TPR) repeat protein
MRRNRGQGLHRKSGGKTAALQTRQTLLARWPLLILAMAIGFLAMSGAALARTEKLTVAPAVLATLDKIYSGDIAGATEDAVRLEQESPEHPIGYLLEAEAMWWRIWCTTAEFKWGMTNTHHRAKLAADRHYFDLAAKVTSLAEAQIRQHESAEMQFYAGMGEALAARLYGLRGEGRNTARPGVRAREHLLRALALDPDFADADFGLGLYNYYVDTLSGALKVLRFFMGIPGGSKEDGIRRLQRAIENGILTPPEASFYLAINLHAYDHRYERALQVITPLVEKYPSNPIFQLAQGDLFAKLGRKEQAIERYRAAAAAPMSDPECSEHIQELARASLAAVGADSPAQ